MRVSCLVPAVALSLVCCAGSLCAQETAGADGFTAATQSQRAVQVGASAGAPLGSPESSPSDTSAYPPYRPRNLDLGGAPGTVYPPDAVPPTPRGMLAHAEPGNPAMVYFSLRHRSGDNLLPMDAAVVAARQQDLIHAATYRGYDLHQAGWLYQQGICPQIEPGSERTLGSPGFLLLHFVRHEGSRISSFTAIVPRDSSLPVRTIAVAHGSMEQHHDFLSVDTTGAVVNEAIPPRQLYASLQPLDGWIAAAACIAEMGGAYPHIPNEPSLSRALVLAPSPYLRLELDGQREVRFTDRVDAKHYVVWEEQLSKTGKLLKAHRQQVAIVTRPVTNPPVPKARFTEDIPQPPSKITAAPPGPVPTQLQ